MEEGGMRNRAGDETGQRAWWALQITQRNLLGLVVHGCITNTPRLQGTTMLSAHDFTIWPGVGWVILLLALPVVFSVMLPGTLGGLSPSPSLHEFSEPLLLYVVSLAGQLDF